MWMSGIKDSKTTAESNIDHPDIDLLVRRNIKLSSDPVFFPFN